MIKKIYELTIGNEEVQALASNHYGGTRDSILADYENYSLSHMVKALPETERRLNATLIEDGIIKEPADLKLSVDFFGSCYCTKCESWFHEDDGCEC